MPTKYAYEYGRRWNVKTPRNDIGWIVDQHHVGESEENIKQEIERRIPKDNPAFTESIRKQCIEYALLRHKKNYELYLSVAKGR